MSEPAGSRGGRRGGAWVEEFRDFLLRGNLVDLAVAVVVGLAFANVVQALVRDLITPLIAAVGGKPFFGALTFSVNGSRFLYGDFVNSLFSFLVVAAAVFFLVIKPVNALMARRRTEPPAGGDAILPRMPERDPTAGAALRLVHGRRRARRRVAARRRVRGGAGGAGDSATILGLRAISSVG